MLLKIMKNDDNFKNKKRPNEKELLQRDLGRTVFKINCDVYDKVV